MCNAIQFNFNKKYLFCISLKDLFLRLKSIFTSKRVSNINAYNDLKYLDNYIPQLFMYSNADKLISSKVSVGWIEIDWKSRINLIHFYSYYILFIVSRISNRLLISGKVLVSQLKLFAFKMLNMWNSIQATLKSTFNACARSSATV